MAGERYVSPAGGFVAYLLHFNGLNWTTTITFGRHIEVEGVSAVSGSAAWVWGYEPANSIRPRPFLAMVSGGAVHQVRLAMLGSVFAVAGDGAADTWLMGGARDQRAGSRGVVAARWDGATWHEVPAPAGVNGINMSLSTSGPSDTWLAAQGDRGRPWLLHWNGKDWTRAFAPPASLLRTNSQPGGMSVASSARHAWVVYNEVSTISGSNGNPVALPGPFSAYFDGSTWRSVRVPAPFSSLTGIAMTGADAWATGGLGTHSPRILYSHQGNDWCVQPLPLPRSPGCSPRPSAISAASPTYIIAVSSTTSVGCRRSLAYIYDGHRWRSVNPRPAG